MSTDITTTRAGADMPFCRCPIISVLILTVNVAEPESYIITILVGCMLLAAILEFLRGFNYQKTSLAGWSRPSDGRNAFAGVVYCCWFAAGVFARG